MSITYAYANIAAQQASKNAAVTMLSLAALGPAVTRTEKNGSVVISEYVLKGTDPAKPTVVSLRQESTKEGGKRNSLRLATAVTVSDDVADTETVEIHEAVIAWNFPRAYLGDTEAMSRLIQGLFSIIMSAFDGTTGIPTNQALEDANYGVTNDL